MTAIIQGFIRAMTSYSRQYVQKVCTKGVHIPYSDTSVMTNKYSQLNQTYCQVIGYLWVMNDSNYTRIHPSDDKLQSTICAKSMYQRCTYSIFRHISHDQQIFTTQPNLLSSHWVPMGDE